MPFEFMSLVRRNDVPADLQELGARFRQQGGVRIATMLPGHWLLGGSTEDFARNNEAVVVPPTGIADLPFAWPEAMPTPQQVRAFALAKNQGVVEDPRGGFAPVACPHFETAQLVVVRFLEVSLEDRALADHWPLFVNLPGRMIVPFVGDVHANGRSLTVTELRALGLELLLDANQEPLRYLALMQGNRSVFFPSLLGIGLPAPGFEGPLGWQFKGVGVPRYLFHTVMKREGRMPNPLASTDVLIEGGDLDRLPHGAASQRPAYAGRSGVFDLPHQPASIVPIGGETREAADDVVATERAMRGLTPLGRTVTQVGRLIDLPALTQLLGPTGYQSDLVVVCETWDLRTGTPGVNGSTIRLETVTRPLRAGPDSMLEARRQARENMDALLRAELGLPPDAEVEQERRDAKLRQLACQFGLNIKVGLETMLLPWVDRNTDDNLTWPGLQLDYADFTLAAGWHEIASLAVRYLVDLHRLGAAAGYSSTELFEAGFVAPMLERWLPAAAVARAVEDGKRRFRSGKLLSVEISENRPYILANRRWACRVMAEKVLPGLTVQEAEVGPDRRFIEPSRLLEYCVRSATITWLLDEEGVVFDMGSRTLAQSVKHLLRGGSVRIGVGGAGMGTLMSAQDTAKLLLPRYVRGVLEEYLLIKDDAERRKPRPPLDELEPAGVERLKEAQRAAARRDKRKKR